MISFEKALQIVLDNAVHLGEERVELNQVSGRILSSDLFSDIDLPPFNKSNMDGYACRRIDLEKPLEVIEEIPAGKVPEKILGEGQCSKIMTGAMLPSGADCVVMIEKIECLENNRICVTRADPENHIHYRAQDLRQGDLVLEKGELLDARRIAILATFGNVNPLVSLSPKIGIIATGDEIVEPNKKTSGAQIRNSNSVQLATQVRAMGLKATLYGVAADTEDAIDSKIKAAMLENEVILVSAGVSMGDYDFVPKSIENNGFEILFNRVAMKPGKPSTFAVAPKHFCFGLPGNPVSTFAMFELIVKPFLYKMMGHDFKATVMRLPISRDFSRRLDDRLAFIPAKITREGVEPVEFHGSGHHHALCHANAFISVPVGVKLISQGEMVDVRSF